MNFLPETNFRFTYLLNRNNTPNSQRNLYMQSGVSSNGLDNFFYGIHGDWETRRLFAGFGIPPIRPFYSRTIGLDKKGNKIPILFGARLSGNLSPDVRIGAMNMQTGRQGDYAPENFCIYIAKKSFKKIHDQRLFFE